MKLLSIMTTLIAFMLGSCATTQEINAKMERCINKTMSAVNVERIDAVNKCENKRRSTEALKMAGFTVGGIVIGAPLLLIGFIAAYNWGENKDHGFQKSRTEYPEYAE